MRKFLLAGIAVLMVLFITACGSKEEDEVLDFHNEWVDTVKPIYEETIDILNEISMAGDEEAAEMIEQKLVPKAEEAEKFFEKYDPETEPTIEYYGLRKDANDYLVGYTHDSNSAANEFIDGVITEDEFLEEMAVATADLENFMDLSQQAEDRMDEISEEYSFEELED